MPNVLAPAGMDLGEVLHVLRKRRSWIAIAAVAGVIASALWTFTREPLYQAVTQIEVVGRPAASLVRENGLVDLEESSEFETHRYLLTTPRILEATASSLDLAARLGRPAGAGWLKQHVTVERVPDTRIFRITATAPSPELAKDVANTLRDVYEKDDVERRLAGAKRQLAWLNEQMVNVKKQVETSELALLQYVETANLDLVEIPESEEKEDDLKPTGSKILASLEDDLSKRGLELDRMRLDRTEQHPEVVRAKQEVKLLQNRIADEKKRVAKENEKRIRYGMLRRDAELNRQLYHLLMKEVKETNLVGDDGEGRLVVLEKASAPSRGRPVYPKRAANVALGLAAGLLFGIGLAFLQESLDRTLKSREEIERVLGLPVLGTIHRVGSGKRAAGDRFLVKADGSWSPELEDFRTLRTNLRFARPEGENRTVLVTSTAPQEGKTTIATNLAVVCAQAGERVLLVDADLRRPAVHLALGIENGVGLTNLLVEREGAPEGEALKTTPYPMLTVITAGAYAPNPPDILESARMRELLGSWKRRFDRVIVDSPPQSSVVDPAILTPLADGVLLVVSSGRVEGERARLAKRQLQSAGAKFYGILVNQLSKDSDRYGYSYGYGYGYGGYGYGRRQEEAASDKGGEKDEATPLPPKSADA